MKKRWASFLIALVLIQSTSAAVLFGSEVSAEPFSDVPTVMISAIKTDGRSTSTVPFVEYVDLFNPGLSVVDVSGWELEYLLESPELERDTCKAAVWARENVAPKKLILPLESRVEPHTNLRIDFGGMNDDRQGAVRLIQYTEIDGQPSKVIHDVVGWGDDILRASCAERDQAAIARDKQLLMRCVTPEGTFRDSDDNARDFVVASSAEPIQLKECSAETPEEPPTPHCNEVLITEVLPNPDGADSGGEFIEIHNPTNEEIDINGCSLYVSGSTKSYIFADEAVLAPGSYRAFFDSKTGLTLPNSAGGEVVLVSSQEEYAYVYPKNMKSGESWVQIDDIWQATNRPTPHAENLSMFVEDQIEEEDVLASCPEGKYRNPETNRCRKIETSSGLKPCDEGQERNPETNRCRSIVATLASLLPCKAGQERNPLTNRCRTVLSKASTLIPCKDGQKRNPETNRCRSVLSANSALKPCDEGQERNPETNRCRKVASSTASVNSKTTDKSGSEKQNYVLLGVVGATALGYGAYEYRGDFRNKLLSLRSRFRSTGKGRD
jgi:hypothetical protein